MKKHDFSYSSLSRPVAASEAASYRVFSLSMLLGLSCGLIILLSGILLFMLHQEDADAGSSVAAVIVVGAILLISMMVYYGKGIRKAETLARIARFARANGLSFIAHFKNPRYKGTMFGVGNSRHIAAALQYKDKKAVYEIGNYDYAIGYSSARQSFHYGYIRITQQRHLPHLAIVSTRHKASGPFRNAAVNIGQRQKLGLEGNFDDYFTLYAPQKYEADALYMITPNVMAALIDNVATYDLEIIDNELYIYRDKPFDLKTQTGIEAALHICDTVGAKIDHQTDYYADQKIDDRSVDAVTTQGYRLKQTPSWLLAVYALYVIGDGWLITTNLGHIPVAQLISGLVAFLGLTVGVLERLQHLHSDHKARADHNKKST